MNPGVFIRSILHLKPSMVYWRVHRTVKGACISIVEKTGLGNLVFRPLAPPPHIALPHLTSVYHCEDIQPGEDVFTFLNDTTHLPKNRPMRLAAVRKKPLLWQFHYGYHDYLLALVQQDENNETLRTSVLGFMRRWLDDYPLAAHGARRSPWHAYVLSIRIESWIRLSAYFPNEDFIPGHIYQMTCVLRRNMEFGTMANHLMKNIKALVLAGLYFEGAKGKGFSDYSTKFLRRELREQILADGMHFERSPMYHVAMTSDVIDLYEALGNRAPEIVGSAAKAMMQFLTEIVHPDGEVPFFNDSTSSFFLKTAEVLQRGNAIFGLQRNAGQLYMDGYDADKMSGLVYFRDDIFHGVVDIGNVGPDYQPGHAHCDTLSFELSVKTRRFITDTGIFHYKESPERTWSRCTSAHNTVKIDGVEQSEIWKSFRVGRRASIVSANVLKTNGLRVFTAAHDGYMHIANDLFHERFIVVSPAAWIAVIDMVHGSLSHTIESNLHFTHGAKVIESDADLMISVEDDIHARLRMSGFYADLPPRIHSTEYYPAFGKKEWRQSVSWAGNRTLPAIGGYVFSVKDDLPRIEYSSNPLRFRILSESGLLYESSSGLL